MKCPENWPPLHCTGTNHDTSFTIHSKKMAESSKKRPAAASDMSNDPPAPKKVADEKANPADEAGAPSTSTLDAHIKAVKAWRAALDVGSLLWEIRNRKPVFDDATSEDDKDPFKVRALKVSTVSDSSLGDKQVYLFMNYVDGSGATSQHRSSTHLYPMEPLSSVPLFTGTWKRVPGDSANESDSYGRLLQTKGDDGKWTVREPGGTLVGTLDETSYILSMYGAKGLIDASGCTIQWSDGDSWRRVVETTV